MSTGDLNKQVSARTCTKCGQRFKSTVKFCPEDGTKLLDPGAHAGSSENKPPSPAASELKSFVATAESKPFVAAPESKQFVATSESKPFVAGDAAPSSADAKPYLSQPEPKAASSQSKAVSPSSEGKSAVPPIAIPPGGAKTAISSVNLGSSSGNPPLPIVMPSDATIGAVIDNNYEILSVIGQGGMSIVYKAHHMMLKKTVALKTLLPHLVLHPTSLERFRQEAQASSHLVHPNIVTIHHFGFTSNGQPFIVMDYLEGMALSAIIHRDRNVSANTACHIFAQIADGLAHAHRHGVVHRDLKPSNIILIEKFGNPYHVQIVDFGIAKLLPQGGQEAMTLTQTGELFGSPLYMSPEQCTGGTLDARSDIYSLGCLMYETLAGKPPLLGDNSLEILYKQVNTVPPPFSSHGVNVPKKLEAIVFKCLAKNPAQRYQSMEELCVEIRSMFNKPTTPLSRLVDQWQLFLLRRPPKTGRDKALVLVETLLLILSLIATSYVVSLEIRAKESPAAKASITWVEDQPPVSTEPTSHDEREYENLRAGFESYTRGKFKDDPQYTSKLISKLKTFGTKMAEQGHYELASSALKMAWLTSRDYNGAGAFATLLIQIGYADVLYDSWHPGAAQAYINILQNIERRHLSDENRGMIARKIADCMYREKKYFEAGKNYLSALQSLRATSNGESDRLFADSGDQANNYIQTMCLSHLADCQYELALAATDRKIRKDYIDASVKNYSEAVTLWNRMGRDKQADVNVTKYKMARALFAANDFQQAERLYKELMTSNAFGANTLSSGLVAREYADVLWKEGNIFGSLKNRLTAWSILADAKPKQ